MSPTLLRTSRITVSCARAAPSAACQSTLRSPGVCSCTFDDPTIIDNPVRFNSSVTSVHSLRRRALDPTIIDGPKLQSQARAYTSTTSLVNDPTIIDISLSRAMKTPFNDPTIIDNPLDGFVAIEDPTIIDERITV